jgi:hypothetical protein
MRRAQLRGNILDKARKVNAGSTWSLAASKRRFPAIC